MAKKYVMVRVTEKTWLDLKAVQKRLQANQQARGDNPLPESEGFGVTLDTVVEELIRRDVAHAARGRRKALRQSQSAGDGQNGIGSVGVIVV